MIIARLLTALAFLCVATISAAQCTGTDIRLSLTGEERREIDERISAIPYPVGNYWIATKDDKTLHIVGTVHINDSRLDAVADRLKPVVEQADLLFVEATADEEAKLQSAISTQPELLFLTDGPTLPELLTEETWQQLSEAVRARGVPPFMAAKFQPWYLSVLLSMPGCIVQQMATGERGLDHRIMAFADGVGIPQLALEPYDTLFKLMGQEPMEKQLEFLGLGILPEQDIEDGMVGLMNSYFEENLAEVFEVNRITARRNIDLPAAELDVLIEEALDLLLVQRNVQWMPHILDSPAKNVVIAVGAGHLPGEKGVLNLLENAGYTLVRQTF